MGKVGDFFFLGSVTRRRGSPYCVLPAPAVWPRERIPERGLCGAQREVPQGGRRRQPVSMVPFRRLKPSFCRDGGCTTSPVLIVWSPLTPLATPDTHTPPAVHTRSHPRCPHRTPALLSSPQPTPTHFPCPHRAAASHAVLPRPSERVSCSPACGISGALWPVTTCLSFLPDLVCGLSSLLPSHAPAFRPLGLSTPFAHSGGFRVSRLSWGVRGVRVSLTCCTRGRLLCRSQSRAVRSSWKKWAQG